MKRVIFTLFISLFISNFASAQKNYNVYTFIAEECPISIYMAKPLREAVKLFDQQANFYAVFPSKKSTEATAAEFLKQYDLPQFQILLDNDKRFTKKMGAEVTPEVAITDAETGEILYCGRISNAYASPGKMRHGRRINDLINMLTRITKGEKIAKPWLPAVGCFITFAE
jgi:hypothetical protein